MVYCTKCGAKNEDDSTVCKECGAPLQVLHRAKRRRSGSDCFGSREREVEDECFGLPYGGAIAGIVFGIIIVFIGIALFAGFTQVWNYLWAIVIVIVGILIIAGALYGMRRRH